MVESLLSAPAESSTIRDASAYRVSAMKRLTPSIVEVWLRPRGEPIRFLPGEYVLLEDTAGEVPPRSYSLANAPRSDGRVSLLVTRVADGATSRWVHDRLRTGDEVILTGPYGTFVTDPTALAPALFLAAGSGLAPIRAMLEASLTDATQRSLSLIFSARAETDVIDGGRFRGWENQHPGFRFVRTLTRGAGPPPHGRIPTLLGDLYPDLSRHDVFIAGAPGFVADCASAAEMLGASRARIHTEVFFADPEPWTRAPPEAKRQR